MSGKLKPGGRVLKGSIYGLAVGWMVGMVWWASLTIAFGSPLTDLTALGAVSHETQQTVMERLESVPMATLPWAIVGGCVGAIIGWGGGWLEIVACFIGLSTAICLQLPREPFCGWLALTMPIAAFIGTVMGLAVGRIITMALKARKRL